MRLRNLLQMLSVKERTEQCLATKQNKALHFGKKIKQQKTKL